MEESEKRFVYFVAYRWWNSTGQGAGNCQYTARQKAGTYDWTLETAKSIGSERDKEDRVTGTTIVLLNWKRLKGDENAEKSPQEGEKIMPARICEDCGESYALNRSGVIHYLCNCGTGKSLLEDENFAEAYLPKPEGVEMENVDGEAVFHYE